MAKRALWVFVAAVSLQAQKVTDFNLPRPLPDNAILVLGFLGGWEKWDDPERGVRKLALELRTMGIPNLYAETVSNHRRSIARRLILEAADRNGNNKLDADESHRLRVILYGQSMGGGAVVRLAHELNKLKVPLLLTVQVDSISVRDGRIPPNVKMAANFYQSEILTIHGQQKIEAMDPAATTILGNFHFRYPVWFPFPRPEGWWRRTVGGAHARMEVDPLLWLQVKSLILTAIGGASVSASVGRSSKKGAQ